MKPQEILEKAQESYKKGMWKEATELINKNLNTLQEEATNVELAKANKALGWSYYYLGTKGPEEQKSENIEKATSYFKTALFLLEGLLLSEKEEEKYTEMSVRNGLPLSLWVLGKKREAKLENMKATEKFPQEPSVWNTRAILSRWAKDFEESVKVCQKVYETAKAVGDYRMAGHGKHNQGDAFVRLHKNGEALESYLEAEKMYIKDGESNFHLEAVREKMKELKNK